MAFDYKLFIGEDKSEKNKLITDYYLKSIKDVVYLINSIMVKLFFIFKKQSKRSFTKAAAVGVERTPRLELLSLSHKLAVKSY